MITIIYDPNSENPEAISPKDGKIDNCADYIQSAINGENKLLTLKDNYEIIIANFLLIMELRARIVEKKIDWQKAEETLKQHTGIPVQVSS